MARTGGPVPKLLAERRRGDRSEGPPLIQALRDPSPVTFATSDPDWHPIAQRWYDSLPFSGQVQFYEPSDFAAAYLLAQVMSDGLLSRTGLSSSHLNAILSGMTDLLCTEGARRRARIELLRPDEAEGTESPEAVAMAAYRAAAA